MNSNGAQHLRSLRTGPEEYQYMAMLTHNLKGNGVVLLNDENVMIAATAGSDALKDTSTSCLDLG